MINEKVYYICQQCSKISSCQFYKNEMEDMNTKVEMFEPIKGDIEIYLPNVETVDAKLEDGILTLIAPKQSKGVKIEIQ